MFNGSGKCAKPASLPLETGEASGLSVAVWLLIISEEKRSCSAAKELGG